MNIDKLKTEALRLSPEARAYLARELLSSLDILSETEIEKLWVDEAIRRDKEFDDGTVRAQPADEVLARARGRASTRRAPGKLGAGDEWRATF